ncbi:MAG: O-antigen ligase family protein [Patescibacteria group bacterium]|nr:O-antigen ligase family protein [Patescibacteria group bacterium]
MGLSRKAYEIVWRLAILTLPWQTRWFVDAQLVGWPWEQGRISIYIAWLPLVATIILGIFQPKRALPFSFRRNLFWLIAALGACTIIAAPSPATAAIQWWIQVILLAAFFVTLFRTKVEPVKVALWFVLSLVPHALLAIWQFATQTVIGSSWLGMSPQNPADLGVSVVQTSVGRFLRAYGGFPHPNILGGWMATGLLTALWFNIPPLKLRGGKGVIWLIEGLFTLALFYSFSRSAWLAAAVGLALFVIPSVGAAPAIATLRRCGREESAKLMNLGESAKLTNVVNHPNGAKRRWLSFAIPIILFATLTIVHRDLVFTRLQTTSRLEQKSIVTRLQTLKDGIDVFQSRLLFGTGPNSELPVLASLKKQWIEEDSIRIAAIGQFPGHPNSWNADEYVRSRMAAIGPLEPPHIVWLLILVNFGIAGSLFIFGFGLYLLRSILNKWSSLDPNAKIFIPTLAICYLILATLDHYPWSLWSGQVLSVVVVFVILSAVEGSGPKLDEKHSPRLLTDGSESA